VFDVVMDEVPAAGWVLRDSGAQLGTGGRS